MRQRLDADLHQRMTANQRHFWWVTGPLTAILLVYLYLMIGAYLSLRATVGRVREIAARVNAQDPASRSRSSARMSWPPSAGITT